MKSFLRSICGLLALMYAVSSITLTVQASSDYSISGYVYDLAGRNVPEAKVCAVPVENHRGVICTTADVEGRYTLKLALAGKYQMIPDKIQEGYLPQYVPFYRHPSYRATEVTVDQSHTNTFVALLLGPKNGLLTGSIIDATSGLPLENVRIIIIHAADPNIYFRTSAKDATGKFRVFTPHVPFTLRIKADGYEEWLGASGTGLDETLSVAAGEAKELVVRLKRLKGAKNRPLGEAEKEVGVNLSAPVQLSPADNVKLDYFPRLTKLEWTPVEGAASYSVEVDYCRGRREYSHECVDPQPFKLDDSPPMTGIAETSYEFNFLGAQPGRWRVWAVDKDGREGFKSPWRTFFYLK